MKRMLYVLIICFLQFSCERRELTYNYRSCKVAVHMDWSRLEQASGVAPSGMSVMFYPQQEGDVVMVQSNHIDKAIVALRAGRYNILVFNQIPSDFGTIAFKGMDSFETAEVFAKPMDSKWYKPTGGDEIIARKPEYLAVATYLDFEITEEMVDEAMQLDDEYGEVPPSVILDFEPKLVIKNISIQMRVVGIQNIQAVRAAIKGMSVGYHFASCKSRSNTATHLLEEWQKTNYEGTSTEGELRTVLASFGLPKQLTSTKSEDDWTGSLAFEILLVDNKTLIKQESFLDKHFVTLPGGEQSADLLIKVGLSTDPDDKPIELPDVEPEGDGGGGFEGDLGDWEDEEIVDIPLT